MPTGCELSLWSSAPVGYNLCSSESPHTFIVGPLLLLLLLLCASCRDIESLIKICVNRDAVSVDADAVFDDVFESQSLDTLEKQNCM